MSAMKLIRIIPKQIFRSRKSRSVSRSDPFGSAASSSSESSDSSSTSNRKKAKGCDTPTSVLPAGISTADGYCELLEAFKLIDRDGDGKITTEELVALLSRVGGEPPSQEDLAAMLSEVDRDGDGCISLEEFGAISSAFGPPACDSELKDAFEFFDADRDGKITAEELHRVFGSIGVERCTLEECRRMIRGVDRNGDGFVCFEDFALMMVQQR